MRKLFALAGIIIALAFPAMSFGADSAIILSVNGTDYIPDPTVTTEYKEDEETWEITKGVVTFPAPSGKNYTFSTIDNSVEFAKDPKGYIEAHPEYMPNGYDESYYDAEYDSSLQSAMTAVTISIELVDEITHVNTIDNPVDLTGYSGIEELTITATPASLAISNSEQRHFIAGTQEYNTTFRGITFILGEEIYEGESGGGVEVKEGTVTFSGCTFDGCLTSSDGGGVLVTGGNAVFTYTTFTNCSADKGGAVAVTRGNATISDSLFSDNNAGSGGAIYVARGSISMDSTIFTDNTARSNGGAIYSSAQLTIGNSVTFNNVSLAQTAANGGAIYVDGGLTEITGSSVEFVENRSQYGGAVFVASGRLNISGSGTVFSGNTVSNDGGAICASGDKPTITISSSSASFDRNIASVGNGGAIYASGGAQINISGAAVFSGNEANYGGAVYLIAATRSARTALNVTGENETLFSTNKAGTDGGAIYAGQYSTMSFISTVRFAENETNNGNGGALWVYEGSQLPEGTVYFDSNKAIPKNASKSTPKGCGGAIYINGSSESATTFTSTRAYTFSGNEAESYGGAIFTSSDIVFDSFDISTANNATLGGGFVASFNSKITLQNNSSVSNQTTDGEGGAIYSMGGLDITDSELRSNSANQGGGAVYADASNVNITNSYFASNTSSNGNGGAIHLKNYCTSIITESTFRDNKSSYLNGGAIYAQGSLSITHCYLWENQSHSSGGAIYFDQNNDNSNNYSRFTMTSTMLAKNSTSGFESNGGGLYVVANNVKITNCTFNANRLELGGHSGEGGGAYVSAMPIQDEDIQITNCTFYDNHVSDGASGSSGGGGLALHCEKTAIVKSCTFAVNGSQYKGGGIYLAEGSTLQLSATMLVGNTDEGTYDIWSDGSISSGGYNRIGVYGTGTGVTDFYSETRNDTDRTAYPSKGWTFATFYSNNALAINERTDLGSNIPPYIGNTTAQTRLMTLMLSEDASLPLIDRATNIIPYTRRGMFPTTDERGVPRISQGSQINLDIGACFFDGTRFVSGDSEIASYTISRLEISGIPNNLRRVGQTASLLAKIYYTNGRTALGGYGDGEEPVEWTSDKPNIIRINKDTGDITVLSFTPGDTYVTITAATVRTDTSGQRIYDRQPVKVTEYTYSYLNTSPEIMNYLQGYVQQLTEYDISLQLADVSASAVSSSSFQSAFASIWGNVTASQITDLTNAALTFDTVTNYAVSGYVLAAGKPGVNINFAGLKEGDIFPLTYSWTFSGSDLQSILGYDMAGKTVTASLADEIFSALRLDFQGANYSSPVIGSGGVKASDAISAGALALSPADGGKGLTAQITVYLANVTAGGSLSSSANDGPQIVEGMLIVPDGTGNDGRIFGSMFMAAKTGSAQEVSTNTGTQTGAKSSSGGGGCESFGAALSSLALLLMAVQKRRRLSNS